ncbi:hypothetical protein GCM10009679_24870 [Saccharothrix algeriensis]|uniref:Uncharacterized protein n=1 Tax=Catellatospora bangladeshensis TaxID=310355 RepID=A0A8J3JR69_9ACTN|nr:hypothetical protein Cba03nite_49740 [Catellatospora bangladeshensis]
MTVTDFSLPPASTETEPAVTVVAAEAGAETPTSVPSDTIATTPTRANQDRRWVVTATAFQAPRYPTASGVWGALREYTARNYALRRKDCATQGPYIMSKSHLVSSAYVPLA